MPFSGAIDPNIGILNVGLFVPEDPPNLSGQISSSSLGQPDDKNFNAANLFS